MEFCYSNPKRLRHCPWLTNCLPVWSCFTTFSPLALCIQTIFHLHFIPHNYQTNFHLRTSVLTVCFTSNVLPSILLMLGSLTPFGSQPQCLLLQDHLWSPRDSQSPYPVLFSSCAQLSKIILLVYLLTWGVLFLALGFPSTTKTAC